jgi:hypothetical protein
VRRERLGFRRRAALYAGLDARLRNKTRFFGAACLTNCVLAHLVTIDNSISSSGTCIRWLWNLGALLETINLAAAEDLKAESEVGPALDEHLISKEQAAVEKSLQGATADFVLQMNRFLNHDRWLGALHFSPEVRWYSGVLVNLREELASPLDFARQPHREAIGVSLTRALRRDERDREYRNRAPTFNI